MAGVRAGLLVGLAALALAGCSSGGDAAPPPVKLDDLNVRPYADKPCTLLNADQLSEYGVSKPGVAKQTTCWLTRDKPAKGGFAVGVGFGGTVPASPRLKIAGYPASEGADAALGACTVSVYVAPTQEVTVSLTDENACHLAEMVATSAIATIKRNSP